MKKILSVLLVFTLLLCAIPAYAATENNVDSNLQKKVQKLADKYGFELMPLEPRQDTIKLKDLEELEKLFKTAKNNEGKL